MEQINAYLTFNGNCREAMTHYQACLGGALSLQAVEGSPLADQMPHEMKHYILHATLIKDGWILMASDMVGEQGLIKGNAVSLMLNCTSETEIRAYYARLSEGGQATHPLEITFWGALFGGLTDKWGNQWLLHFQE
ncbi:MAG: VOC family protein [Saprospiraceae bacterium]